MLLLSGRIAADAILNGIAPGVRSLNPLLVIVQVGSDPASDSYIRRKLDAAASIGMRAKHLRLQSNIRFDALLDTLNELNRDQDASGYILQMPLPDALEKRLPEIHRMIDPKKDVDGFTAYNLGKTFLAREFEHLPPATPAGIVSLLEHYKVGVAGKHAVIVGRSNTVGKPLGIMLLHRDATITICHSRTPNLAQHTKQADLLVSAAGQANFITADMVKEGAVVIDVGLTSTDEGLVGDVDFDAVSRVASAITPVPGGVGPMTVASLLRNVVRAKERQMEEEKYE